MKNNFLITSHGRTGTLFLAKLMNNSSQWTVKHQPDNRDGVWDDKIDKIGKGRNPYEWMQKRFERSYYGEVNGLLRYCLPYINVYKKGVIYRHPMQIILSFYNGKDERQWEGALLRKINDVIMLDETFYNWLVEDKDIKLINFNRMVSERHYLRNILSYFGINDVEITEKMMRKKINVNSGEKNFMDLPKEAKRIVRNTKWNNYKLLENWII